MLKYMNYAYMIYKEKSFTKAAEKLYISQPSLSLTIKKLEDELGFPLFERCGKEIHLTQVGEKYIKAIEEIISIKNNFLNELDDLKKLKKGSIIIGSTTFISSYYLSDILMKFGKKYPEISISLIVEQSTVLDEKLNKGEVDIVIDNTTAKDPSYKYIPLITEHILLGVPDSFEINEKLSDFKVLYEDIKASLCNYNEQPKVNLKFFEKEEFILLKHGNNMRQLAYRIFKESCISPEIIFEFDQLMTAISYAERGFGACFLTDTIIKYGKGCDNLTLYLPETEHSTRTLYIMYKKSKYLSCASREFINFITSI